MTAIELIEEKVKFQIDIVKMDYNNGVQISMSVFSGMLKKILIEIKQAKEMEKQQIIDAYETSHISMMTSEQYYNEFLKKKQKSIIIEQQKSIAFKNTK